MPSRLTSCGNIVHGVCTGGGKECVDLYTRQQWFGNTPAYIVNKFSVLPYLHSFFPTYLHTAKQQLLYLLSSGLSTHSTGPIITNTKVKGLIV